MSRPKTIPNSIVFNLSQLLYCNRHPLRSYPMVSYVMALHRVNYILYIIIIGKHFFFQFTKTFRQNLNIISMIIIETDRLGNELKYESRSNDILLWPSCRYVVRRLSPKFVILPRPYNVENSKD